MKATNELQHQNIRHDELTAAIVSAYVSRNHVAIVQLPQLIASIHSALCGLDGAPSIEAAPRNDGDLPTAVRIRRSVTDDALTSFIDGRRAMREIG